MGYHEDLLGKLDKNVFMLLGLTAASSTIYAGILPQFMEKMYPRRFRYLVKSVTRTVKNENKNKVVDFPLCY